MLSIKNISKSFGEKTIFSNINFTLDKNEKIVLVGPNGSGKSTLLKIIAGQIEQDTGDIILSDKTSVGYMPQELDTKKFKTIEDYAVSRIKNWDSKQQGYKLNMLFSLFDMPQIKLDTEIKTLSGGQKNKLILSVFLLEPHDVLLLDEPTNNIDIKTIIALEIWLSQTKKSIIVISHDIHFLDSIGTKVIEINPTDKDIQIQKGKYTDYLREKEIKAKHQEEEYKKYIKEKEKFSSFDEDTRGGMDIRKKFLMKQQEKDKHIKGRGAEKAGKTQRNTAILKKRFQKLDDVEKPFEAKEISIAVPFDDSADKGDLNIIFDNAEIGYNNEKILGPISINIPFGEKVVIIGENGTGKTTLLKSIMKEADVIKGVSEIGKDLKISNIQQDHESMDKEMTVLEAFILITATNKEKARHQLSNIGFEDEHINTKIKDISPGQRARVLLSSLPIRAVNTIILDEPTNHLDIEAINILEKTLSTFNGTIITVSHDQKFIEKLKPTKIYAVKTNKIETIENYEKHLQDIRNQSEKLIKALQIKLSNIQKVT